MMSPPQDAVQVCFTLRCSQKCELTLNTLRHSPLVDISDHVCLLRAEKSSCPCKFTAARGQPGAAVGTHMTTPLLTFRRSLKEASNQRKPCACRHSAPTEVMHSVIKEEAAGSDGDDRAPPRADLVPARAISLKPAEARSASPRVSTHQCHATAYVEVLEHIPACKAPDMGQEVLFRCHIYRCKRAP